MGELMCTKSTLRIRQHVRIARVTLLHAERVADFVQAFGVALADGVHVRARMPLIDRNELGAEAQANNGHIEFLVVHHWSIRFKTIVGEFV